jgi:hypothetical protein
MQRVKGSQESVPPVEIGKTNVYIRTNVERIESDEFEGWEYDEEIISLPTYIDRLQMKIADQDNVLDDIIIALLRMM